MYGLFKNAISTADYIAYNDGMTGE